MPKRPRNIPNFPEFLNEREARALLRCCAKTLRRRRIASPDGLGSQKIQSASPHGCRYLYPTQRIRGLIETPLTPDQAREHFLQKYRVNQQPARAEGA